jgi:hypothetical protein
VSGSPSADAARGQPAYYFLHPLRHGSVGHEQVAAVGFVPLGHVAAWAVCDPVLVVGLRRIRRKCCIVVTGGEEDRDIAGCLDELVVLLLECWEPGELTSWGEDKIRRVTRDIHDPAHCPRLVDIELDALLPWVFFVVGYAQGSAQIGGEVKRASRNQYLAMVGGVLVNGAMLALLVLVFMQAVGVQWIGSVGYLSLNHPDLLNLPGNLSPSFNFIVSLLTGNVLVPLVIGIGFIFWALMGTPLSELQATRYMLAWAVDRMIPSPLGDVSERFHSPVKAIVFCTVTGTLALIALVTVPQASLLGALLAQIAAFILVSIAGIFFPYRLRHVWEAAGGHKILGIPSVTLAGIGGVLVLGSLMLLFIFNSTINSTFGVTARLSLSFMIGVVVAGILWYVGAYFLNRNQGIDLGLTYREIPPE